MKSFEVGDQSVCLFVRASVHVTVLARNWCAAAAARHTCPVSLQQEKEMEKQKLLYQQARLHDRGAAEMVLQTISASKGGFHFLKVLPPTSYNTAIVT